MTAEIIFTVVLSSVKTKNMCMCAYMCVCVCLSACVCGWVGVGTVLRILPFVFWFHLTTL